MNTLNYNQIRFLKSVNHYEGLPPDLGAEVAFGGRSNAGKSSAINAITGVNRLARTSKSPGRTQLINFFELDPTHRLVDLPGYGYAKVPDQLKLHWKQLISDYLASRISLKGIILLMDIRHPLKPLDWQMIEWSVSRQLSVHILLTKADKLKRAAAQNTLVTLKKELSGYESLLSIQLFSAFTGIGVEEARLKLDEWLHGSN